MNIKNRQNKKKTNELDKKTQQKQSFMILKKRKRNI